MKRIALAVLLLGIVTSAPALADTATCEPGSNQLALDACAMRDDQSAERRLNGNYRAVMAALPAEQRQALREEQQAWRQQREADCQNQTRNSADQISWRQRYYQCLQSAAEQRTEALTRWRQ